MTGTKIRQVDPNCGQKPTKTQCHGKSLQSPPIGGPHPQERHYLVEKKRVLTIGIHPQTWGPGVTCWGPNDPISMTMAPCKIRWTSPRRPFPQELEM